MCKHFCFGGVMLISIFLIVFTIAIFVNLNPPKSDDLSYYEIQTCELFYSEKREIFASNQNDNFPLVVQLYYRTKDNSIKNLCNGVVIHPNYILTLAQCLVNNSDRELISVTTTEIQNTKDKNYTIIEIIIHEAYVNHTTGADGVGLIKIDNNVKLADRFCTRPLENDGETLLNVWNGPSCNISIRSPNIILVDSIRAAQLGDPLIEQQYGVWYLIGLHHADQLFPTQMSIYTNVYHYRNWISNIIHFGT